MKDRMFIINLLLTITLLASCNTGGGKDKSIPIVQRKESVIILPDSLETYAPFNNGNLDSQLVINSPLKIYSYLDVSCPSCLARIDKLKNFANELSQFKIPIILICQSEDNFELLKYLCEHKEIPELPFPFYFDAKNQFFVRNKFLNPSPGGHTVLTDKNNKVLVSGDMTLDPKIKQKYLDTIKIHNLAQLESR